MTYAQAELDRRLLDAANALRGPVDPVDFKAYIFPLLFFKRISDTSRWEYEKALESFDGDEALARHPDNFRFVVPEGCHWEDLQQVSENVGAALQSILDRIQEANPETLAGIFGGVQWADKERLPESALEDVLDVFDRLKLDPENVSHDLLGNAYEYLLKNFADESGKKAGEFFTPRAVVRLMAQILEPKAGESICDPACGSGGILIESINGVRERGEDVRTLRIYGQEVNQTTAAIARMNLYLHDIETFRIARGDTLRDPKLKDENGGLQRFDVIVANPPFSLKGWGRQGWAEDPFGRSEFGVPPENFGDFAFVEHMITAMKPDGGRMAVVMPHGVLERARVEREIRKNLLKAGLLEAVIALAPNLFYATGIAACVLVCRTEISPKRANRVLFVDGVERFQKGKSQNELTESDVTALVEAYRSGEVPEGEDGVFVRSVAISEIEENSWDLNISRYIDRPIDPEIEVTAAVAQYRETRDEMHEAERALDVRLKEAGFG